MDIALLSLVTALQMLEAGNRAGSAMAPLHLVQSQVSTGEAALPGTEWLLVNLGDKQVDPAIGASLAFGMDGGVSGNGGCNRFRGGVEIEGSSLQFGELASTMMACPQDATARLETAYHAALAETVSFRVDQGELMLLDVQDEVVAHLKPAQ